MSHKLKILVLAFTLLGSLVSLCSAEPVAQCDLFAVHQQYLGEAPDTGLGQWSESIVFNDSKLMPSLLPGFPWPGVYSISPDAHWMVRIQKTGSGTNEVILYQIESNGRLLEVLNFNATLWTASDKVSKLKNHQLYHTGVNESNWSKNGRKLTLVLSGTNIDSRDEIRAIRHSLSYDLVTHVVSINKAEYNARPSASGKPEQKK